MKLIAKDMDISTGDTQIVLLNQKDAQNLDLHHGDRVFLKRGKYSTIAILDIAESKKAVAPGQIGLFEEVLDILHAKHKQIISVDIARKPHTVQYIKKKLDNNELEPKEINDMVKDLIKNRLTDLELSYFISACYTNKLTMRETKALTKAIVQYGERLTFKNKIVVDKHCSGGVPGNRTTMVVIPICVAAGLVFPKTSSRSITSPSGTADTMEVLAPVSMSVKKVKRIADKVGGFMVWGGGMNLATADDKLIRLRHPLSLDPEGMLLASILAKKAAVGATHVLIDIPIGPNTKFSSVKQTKKLKKAFIQLGEMLGMKVKVIISDGKEPIGHGVGPALEARDVLWVLQNDERAPKDLKRKSLKLASMILKIAGIKKPEDTARVMLESGLAYKKMQEIIKAQGGNHKINPDHIKIEKYSTKVIAKKTGTIKSINNFTISKIARIAGAPTDKGSGMYLNFHIGYKVKKGQTLYTIYSNSKDRLLYASKIAKEDSGIKFR